MEGGLGFLRGVFAWGVFAGVFLRIAWAFLRISAYFFRSKECALAFRDRLLPRKEKFKKGQLKNLKNLTFCLLLLLSMPVNAAQEFKFVNAFGEKGAGEAQFAKTLFMAFGPDGAIYVTDTDNFRIQKFNGTAEFAFDIQMKGGERVSVH